MAMTAQDMQAAYQEAYGRDPSEIEVQYWEQYQTSNPLDTKQLVHYLMKSLRSPDGAAERAQVITRAHQQHSRTPTQDDVTYWDNEITSHAPDDADDARAGEQESHTHKKLTQYLQDQPAPLNTP